MKTINARIKAVRNAANLTQTEFGARIGVTKNAVVNMEIPGRSKISDNYILSICREFGIREEWLRTGEGEMNAPEATFDLAEYVKSKGASELELRIIKAYFTLPEDVRRAVMESLSEMFRDAPPAAPKKVHDWTDAEMHAELQRQLDAEKRETGEPSTSYSGNSGAATA